ncbi:unnamed protein product (macronuclear) [Paramecium tetraurelia]|uniref:Uncharacterized protein n=1 Tax=Paramecium tetraurelia TaxID=5888 RepID=A0CXM5_PARTE|nr:uncharacterized protein GSPATT00011174001 [Paramecium tetraurelia]CAK75542.1 unnamed protein product [Paramecium tetraurelia]|eukprot:XP_001442939.1 hypothetical protein (macronuclear) [Paramecium tetraurelia strain d4-2]
MGCSSMKASRKGSLSIPKNGILKKPSPNQSCQLDLVIKKKTLSFQKDPTYETDNLRMIGEDYTLIIFCLYMYCVPTQFYMLKIGTQSQDRLQINYEDPLKFRFLNKKGAKIYLWPEQYENTNFLYLINVLAIPQMHEPFLQSTQICTNKMQQV